MYKSPLLLTAYHSPSEHHLAGDSILLVGGFFWRKLEAYRVVLLPGSGWVQWNQAADGGGGPLSALCDEDGVRRWPGLLDSDARWT